MPARFREIAILTLLFLSFPYRASSPSVNEIVIFADEPVQPYRKLILAVGKVETMNDTLCYNPIEEAAGYFQIRPIRLQDYNRRTGSKYTSRDLFNYAISEKIFLYFADLIGPYDLEQIARKWNGSGAMTTYYWNRIRENL